MIYVHAHSRRFLLGVLIDLFTWVFVFAVIGTMFTVHCGLNSFASRLTLANSEFDWLHDIDKEEALEREV